MKILWYNWRDIKNPAAGGAEVFTHEVAKRLVTRGHEVTLFAAKFEGAPEREEIEGVEVIRRGNKYSVYREAKKAWKEELRKEGYEVVVDEINTRPFMTPKFVREAKVVALIHQLAREYWFYETPFPINFVGYYFLEPRWLSAYKEIPTVTVSESTRKDLEDLGFKRVYVVGEGLSVDPPERVPEKANFPLVIFLGRLKRAKRPDHALEAFKIVKEKIPEAELWFVGDGPMRKELERRAFPGVKFLGRVSEEEKEEILKKAWVLVHPGIREGFGLNVIEANAFGVPVVAYDVPGLRDSVKDGYNGILVPEGDIEELARALERVLRDEELRKKLGENAVEWALHFDWKEVVEKFERVLLEVA